MIRRAFSSPWTWVYLILCLLGFGVAGIGVLVGFSGLVGGGLTAGILFAIFTPFVHLND